MTKTIITCVDECYDPSRMAKCILPERYDALEMTASHPAIALAVAALARDDIAKIIIINTGDPGASQEKIDAFISELAGIIDLEFLFTVVDGRMSCINSLPSTIRNIEELVADADELIICDAFCSITGFELGVTAFKYKADNATAYNMNGDMITDTTPFYKTFEPMI